ncbi:MAG: hypothetical protein U0169_26400 [Polyangiaceae bacterium]
MSLEGHAAAVVRTWSTGESAVAVPWLLLALRFVKVISVSTFVAGVVGSFLPTSLADRQRFAYAIAGPGFGASWVTGFVLAGVTSTSFLSTWILGGLTCSFVTLQVVLFSVGKDGRRSPTIAFAALLPLVATIALMVFRPDP